MEVLPASYMPGDPVLIDKIVCELKSQGIFDSFRKECIADVDTKPAYLNLRQRVEGSVTGFLRKQQWNPDMNKNQLREMLRKNIHESGFLETGVERIVDQVVNPKMSTVFLPKVTDVVYKYLGIKRPESNEQHNRERVGISIDNLLPEDLEAVSPESDRMNDSGNLDEDDDVKMDEDESPPFEPIDEVINEDNNSVDSHLSGFSGLISHDSNQSDGQRPLQIDMDTQMSKQSSDGQSILNEDQNSKMEICEDSNLSKTFEGGESDKNSKSCESEKTSENDSSVKTVENNCAKRSESVETVEKETSSTKTSENDTVKIVENNNVQTDENSDMPAVGKDENKDGVIKQLEGDSDKCSSSVKEERDKDKKENDNKDKKDRDRHRSSDKHKSRSDKKSDRKDKDKYSSKDRDRKDSKSRSERDKDKDKEKEKDRHRSSSRHEKSSSSSSRKESSSSSSSKNKTDSKDKYKESSKTKTSSSSSKSDRHRKSSSSSSSKHDKSKDKDKKDKKYSKDDHYSSKHKSERRSTDRDSNDGSGLKSSSSSYCESNSSSQNSASQAGKAQDSSNSNSNSNDSGNSDSHDVINQKIIAQERKLIKPKIASNIHEARRLMKIRKELKKIETQTKEVKHLKVSFDDNQDEKTQKQFGKRNDDENQNEEYKKDGKKGEINIKIKNETVEIENEVKTHKEEEILKPVTPPLNRSVSMASWDAMEAMLNQNINYDSYYDPEYTEDNCIKESQVEIKQNDIEKTSEEEAQDHHNHETEMKGNVKQNIVIENVIIINEEYTENDHHKNENGKQNKVTEYYSEQDTKDIDHKTAGKQNKISENTNEDDHKIEKLETSGEVLDNVETIEKQSPNQKIETEILENLETIENKQLSVENDKSKKQFGGDNRRSEHKSVDEDQTEDDGKERLRQIKNDEEDETKINKEYENESHDSNSELQHKQQKLYKKHKLTEESDSNKTPNYEDLCETTNKRSKLGLTDEDLNYFSQQTLAELEIKFKRFVKYFTLLKKEISDMETNIELSLCNNIPTTVTDLRGVNKENENKRRLGSKRRKSSTGCESMRKMKNNNNFIEATQPEEKFPLPLSPSDSDKSVERKTEPEPTERKAKSQRYTSEDLYKPRPAIRLTSRRSRAKLE